MKLSGLAGLYGHFIGLSHAWLAPDAISCWLVPSEFMDVNYGLAIKWYLLDRVTLLRIHRFDPIVCFRNTAPPRRPFRYLHFRRHSCRAASHCFRDTTFGLFISDVRVCVLIFLPLVLQ
jgi:hypothetical protein